MHSLTELSHLAVKVSAFLTAQAQPINTCPVCQRFYTLSYCFCSNKAFHGFIVCLFVCYNLGLTSLVKELSFLCPYLVTTASYYVRNLHNIISCLCIGSRSLVGKTFDFVVLSDRLAHFDSC